MAKPGSRAKKREAIIKVQYRFTNKSKHSGNAARVCWAIANSLNERGIICDDVLVRATVWGEDEDPNTEPGEEYWESWMNGEVWE